MYKELFSFFIVYFKRYQLKFLFIIFCETVAYSSYPLIAYGFKNIIDFVKQHYTDLQLVDALPSFYWLAGISFISILFNRISGLTNLYTMPLIRIEVRKDFFAYLQKHSHRYFIENFAGAIGHRLIDLTQQFSVICNMFMFHLLPVSVTLITTIYLYFNVNTYIFLAVIAWTFLYFLISYKLASGLKNKSKIYAEKKSVVSGHIVDSITNIFNVRTYANNHYEQKFLHKYLSHELNAQRKMHFFMEINRLFQETANFVLLTGLVLIALYLLIHRYISLGDFVMVYSLSFSLINTLKNVSMNILEFFESVGAINHLIGTIKRPYEIEDKQGAKDLKVSLGMIEFNKVSFAFNQQQIFKQLNLTISPGENIGIVGISGSGKTTLINLLLRLYELDQGQILIDGQNIQDVTQNSLRYNISLIPQDPVLFNRSLIENIRYGNIEASDEEVYAAAKAADCHKFISQLEYGYNSIAGERGVKLSGGQRQRIILARAFLKNAPILVLDEATSALDSLTEQKITNSLTKLIKNKTVLVIAHRLSTLDMMDKIIVFENGRIIETGTKAELIKTKGRFAELWKLQMEKFVENYR